MRCSVCGTIGEPGSFCVECGTALSEEPKGTKLDSKKEQPIKVLAVNSDHPLLVVFLLDQSWSMNGDFSGSGQQKKDGAANAINSLIYQIANEKCKKGGGVYIDRFFISVIGYGSGGAKFLFDYIDNDRKVFPISEIVKNELRKEIEEDPNDSSKTKFVPIWFEPKAENGTPMSEAFQEADGIVEAWVNEHMGCHPPIIINITDGQPNSDPANYVEKIKRLETEHGGTLVANIHISETNYQPLTFPSNESEIEDSYAKMLFRNSTIIREDMKISLREEFDKEFNDDARLLVYNSDLSTLISAIYVLSGSSYI